MKIDSKSPVVFLTGKNGQVGYELNSLLRDIGQIVAVDVDELDLTDERTIRRTIRDVKPSLIINPAAYTAVDEAEREPKLAFQINERAPGILAEEAAQLNIPIIHFSTDYVFDGRQRGPYREDDLPNPTSVYGKSKLAGERAVDNSGARHVILRLSWVYGVRGTNFLSTMLRLGREREELRIVSDQYGAPTWSREIAAAATKVAKALLNEDIADGVYHLPARGETTWYDFAVKIFELGKPLIPKPPAIVPIPSSEYSTPAERPKYSILSGQKLMGELGITLPHWERQLQVVLQKLKDAKTNASGCPLDN
ncbi:MAG: dTDP-4-dehydrorhamnose reductase [Proteobacteria bacterium]|nr:dTDP-4-dehydrorhamnose reductase [Pseudomonadota bacterium]